MSASTLTTVSELLTRYLKWNNVWATDAFNDGWYISTADVRFPDDAWFISVNNSRRHQDTLYDEILAAAERGSALHVAAIAYVVTERLLR